MTPPGSVEQAERWADSRPSGELQFGGMRASAASTAAREAAGPNVRRSDFTSHDVRRPPPRRCATHLVVRRLKLLEKNAKSVVSHARPRQLPDGQPETKPHRFERGVCSGDPLPRLGEPASDTLSKTRVARVLKIGTLSRSRGLSPRWLVGRHVRRGSRGRFEPAWAGCGKFDCADHQRSVLEVSHSSSTRRRPASEMESWRACRRCLPCSSGCGLSSASCWHRS